MKKNNKKGFAITELLAVTVVVMVVFTTIYSNFLPTAAEYEKRIAYNDVSSQYAAHYIRKLYMDYDFENLITDTNHYVTLYTQNSGCSYLNDEKTIECKKIAESLGIKEVIATKKNLKDLKESKSYKGTELSKYISYLPKFSNSSTTLEEYRLVVKTETGYANTELKVFKPEKANKPTLTENLLPVYYDGSKWVVADEDSDDWYNYDEGIWANAVTIIENERDSYFDTEGNVIQTKIGIEVPMEDINTMWVWIPRYKYTVFNYNKDGNSTTSVKSIGIEFEKVDENGIPTSTGTIQCQDTLTSGYETSEICWDTENGGSSNINGSGIGPNSTYTHPAFTFGDVELTGIWVGKFENSVDGNDITILPGEEDLKNRNIEDTFKIIRNMELTNNPYGFNQGTNVTTYNTTGVLTNDNNSIDIHLVKNMEWGAIAYLAYSQYGIFKGGIYYNDPITNAQTVKQIYMNNCVGGITGRSSGTTQPSASVEKTKTYAYDYDNLGTKASCNWNISGIYDMVGGVSEYTMGTLLNSDYKFEIPNADQPWLTSWTGLNDKYYNKYIYNYGENNATNYKIGKFGDATKEIVGWNAPNYQIMPWIAQGIDKILFIRSGANHEPGGASVFYFNNNTGGKQDTIGSRSVLVINPNGGAI